MISLRGVISKGKSIRLNQIVWASLVVVVVVVVTQMQTTKLKKYQIMKQLKPYSASTNFNWVLTFSVSTVVA